MSGYRLSAPHGAWIDRTQRVRFAFNGRPVEGFAGDTLASALLAHPGVRQSRGRPVPHAIDPQSGSRADRPPGEKRPYVIDDSLQIATIMSATGSFDHRAIDGADGARLMKAFKALVENPLAMVA